MSSCPNQLQANIPWLSLISLYRGSQVTLQRNDSVVFQNVVIT